MLYGYIHHDIMIHRSIPPQKGRSRSKSRRFQPVDQSGRGNGCPCSGDVVSSTHRTTKVDGGTKIVLRRKRVNLKQQKNPLVIAFQKGMQGQGRSSLHFIRLTPVIRVTAKPRNSSLHPKSSAGLLDTNPPPGRTLDGFLSIGRNSLRDRCLMSSRSDDRRWFG